MSPDVHTATHRVFSAFSWKYAWNLTATAFALSTENWIIEEDRSPDGVISVTASAPDGAFWSLSQQPANVDFRQLTDATTKQLREEYPDLEAYPASDEISGSSLSGADFNFSYLDLTNTAEVRCLATPPPVT